MSRTALSLSLAMCLLLSAACAVERDRASTDGVHEGGFADKDSAAFHGGHLKKRGYPLDECRACHGDDYGGGAVGVSCASKGCHERGVEWCGTCHDGKSPPEPVTGGHPAHLFDCSDCHMLPKETQVTAHIDGTARVTLSGLAAVGPNAYPKWDPAERRCTNTYCHGAESPFWESPPHPLACGACHGAPPASHARFAVAEAPEGCAPCHPLPEAGRHIDGVMDFIEPACDTCHGSSPGGAPPPALDGSMSASARGVGAHVRHLDETLSDRIGRPLHCEQCHDVPASMRAEGHLDDAAPADVKLSQGLYDAGTGRCVTACHWDADPGPSWTDTSGAPRACDACHGFPPAKARSGNLHPAVAPSIEVCRDCHHDEVATHVDGHVDFLP